MSGYTSWTEVKRRREDEHCPRHNDAAVKPFRLCPPCSHVLQNELYVEMYGGQNRVSTLDRIATEEDNDDSYERES